MYLRKSVATPIAAALVFVFAACENLENEQMRVATVAAVNTPANTGNSNSSNPIDEFVLLNPRIAVTDAAVKSSDSSEWSKQIKPGTKPFIAVEASSKNSVKSIDIYASSTGDRITYKIACPIKGQEGNVYWTQYPSALAEGAWKFVVSVKDENGISSNAIELTFNVSSQETLPNEGNETGSGSENIGNGSGATTPTTPTTPEQGSGGNIGGGATTPTNPTPATTPTNPTPVFNPQISNFRWNTTGNVKTSDKAEWNPTTFQKGSRLWFGLDSTEVAESVTFILNKNGREERKNLTPANHPGYVGLGTNNGFIWAMYPTVLDFSGNAKIKVEVHYAGNIMKTTREGSFTVVEPAPAKPVAPAVTNLRWGTSVESVMIANRSNWSVPLKKGDPLYIGIDTKAEQIGMVKFTISRNGKLEWWYMTPGGEGFMGTFSEDSVWLTYPNSPTSEVGNLGIALEIAYKNGTKSQIDGSLTVQKPASGDFNQVSFSETGLPASVLPKSYDVYTPEFFEFGLWPQSLKKDNVTINGERHQNQKWVKGNDGAWYEQLTAHTNGGRQYESSDGRKINNGQTYYFKVEPIVWLRMRGRYWLHSMRVIDGQRFHGSTSTRNNGRQIFSSNYYYSDLRAWLNSSRNPLGGSDYSNGGFVNIAFTAEQRSSMLVQQEVKINNAKYHTDWARNKEGYYFPRSEFINNENPRDKVWVLGKTEATSAGFGSHWYEKTGSGKLDDDNRRLRPVTDYAIAKGVPSNTVASCGRDLFGEWWTRSPYHDRGDLVQYVRSSGYADCGQVWAVANNTLGVVPTVCVPSSRLSKPEKFGSHYELD